MKNKKPVKTVLKTLICRHGSKAHVAIALRITERYVDMLLTGKIPSNKVYDDIQALIGAK